MSVRTAVLMFANGVLAVVAALLVYHDVIDRDGRAQMAARMHDDNEATNRALERIASEQSGIRAALSKLPASAGAEDAGGTAVRGDFVSAAGSIKTAIAEFYLTNGRLPASNRELQLPEPPEYRGKSLKSATVTADGGVELVFDATSGMDGGRIRLVPDLAHANAMGLQWRCESPDFAQIKRIVPACEYTPGVASTTAAIAIPDRAR
jgi:hypothetical protein